MALPLKKRKMTAQGGRTTLTTRVNKLQRQVNMNKPELKQAFYGVGGGNTANRPIPIILPDAIDGEEIKLHKVVLRTRTLSPTGSKFMRLLSPKQGFTIQDTDPAVNARELYDVNRTQFREWAVTRFNRAGNTVIREPFEISKTWSIPMTCGTGGNGSLDIMRNQVYIDSDKNDGEQSISYSVSLYYTDN